jgi:hypothetical protein
MNFTDQPPSDPAVRDRPPDELDGLLRAFYLAEMPQPWPALPEPPARTFPVPSHAGRSRWALTRSRFALAASVGLLVAGLWAVGGKLPGGLDSFTASPDRATGMRQSVFDPDHGVDPNRLLLKESLIQDRNEGTKVLIEVFEK